MTLPDPSNPLPQGEGDFLDAELRALLIDCLSLWSVEARVASCGEGLSITATGGTLLVQRAPPDLRPVRWLLHTPERRVGGRPPRATPSIVALLSALRHALGAEQGNKLRIGGAAT